jgi:hypothetical protein
MTAVPHEPPAAQRGFHVGLPEGFIELPLDEVDVESAEAETLVAAVRKRFGMPADEIVAETAASFAAMGELIGASGVDYAAVAFYRSPDDPLRPIMMTLTGTALPSSHPSQLQAVTELHNLHMDSGKYETVEELKLPVGPAVATVAEAASSVELAGDTSRMLTRQLSAWVPDHEGTTIGAISVSTNSFQDWERICVLALDIFETFEWEPIDG